MARRKLTEGERWQIVGMVRGGISYRRVAPRFNVSVSVLSRARMIPSMLENVKGHVDHRRPLKRGQTPLQRLGSEMVHSVHNRRRGSHLTDPPIHKKHKHGFQYLGAVKLLLTASLTALLAFGLFQYMDTRVPEGVTEVWSARILDTALRTNGKIVLGVQKYFGVHGGVTWWTRKMLDILVSALITGRPFGLADDHHLRISDTVYDGVGVRVYEPTNLHGDRRPVLLYFHGGGWSWLSIDVYEPAARELAKQVNMVVVSVAYRQSPEHAHPKAFDDCLKVTEYTINNAKKLRIDPSRVAISGDNAGGQLTAAVALRMKKKIKLQILIYPCIQLFDLQTPSYIENIEYIPGILNDVSMLSYWLSYANISYDHKPQFYANEHTSPQLKKSKYASYMDPKLYMNQYIRTEHLRNMKKPTDFGNEELSKNIESTILDPFFAPLMASDEDHKGLPLTYVLTAGYDVLREDGLIYVNRLRKVGTDVHLAHYNDGFHGVIFFL
ncbi:hypothetical protein ScPMuIL_006214 [Solemya velum]